jgi:hypothetical protein
MADKKVILNKWIDSLGATNPFTNVGGAPLLVGREYEDYVWEWALTNCTPWTKIGFTPTVTTSVSDIWSKSGIYVPLPTLVLKSL